MFELGAEFELERSSKRENSECLSLNLRLERIAHRRWFGSRHKKSRIEENFFHALISYCALATSLYSGEEVAVVGGGNTAVEEALMLSDICKGLHNTQKR